MKNLAAVLEAAGSSLDQVVKTTVFLADMKEFAAMNEVYAKFFTSDPPARATVAAAGLPRDARVEIEAVALVQMKRPSLARLRWLQVVLRVLWEGLSGGFRDLAGLDAGCTNFHPLRATLAVVARESTVDSD